MRTVDAEALEKIDKAFEIVRRLCLGEQRWVMSVPANEERDPDLIITNALIAARNAIKDAAREEPQSSASEVERVYAILFSPDSGWSGSGEDCYKLSARICALRDEEPQSDALREAVRWFAGEMERQLRSNDGKGGWEHCGRSWLAAQARTNLAEAERLTFKERDAVIKAAVDAANFCMMIADNWRPGTPRQPAPEAKETPTTSMRPNGMNYRCMQCGLYFKEKPLNYANLKDCEKGFHVGPVEPVPPEGSK